MGFFASSGPISGSSSSQVLLTLTNPEESKMIVYLLGMHMTGVAADQAAPATYLFGRTTGVPTGGTAQATVAGLTSYPAQASVLVEPACTLAPGLIWSGSPGSVIDLAALGLMVFPISTPFLPFDYSIELLPSESLACVVNPNDTDWQHHATLWWHEG